jgi:SLOG-like protein
VNDVFLSASVPVKGRKYFEGSDPILIHAAVRAFALLTLGRLRIVWGGHPSITPMLWAACESLGVKYATCVSLYQSAFFAEDFPEENKRFGNVKVVPTGPDLSSSLLMLRKAMFSRPHYVGAVFVGGMEGVVEEFRLFREAYPKVLRFVIRSPGGAARYLSDELDKLTRSSDSFDYAKILIDALKINPTDKRLAE